MLCLTVYTYLVIWKHIGMANINMKQSLFTRFYLANQKRKRDIADQITDARIIYARFWDEWMNECRRIDASCEQGNEISESVEQKD
jgi:hypothetical protein